MNAVECISQTNQYLPVLSAFGGSFVTGFFLYLINNTNKKYDEKKHHRAGIKYSFRALEARYLCSY
jgi:hypothetical protein